MSIVILTYIYRHIYRYIFACRVTVIYLYIKDILHTIQWASNNQSISFHLPLRQTLAKVTGPRDAHVHCALKHETAAMSAAGHTLAEHLGRKPRLARG